MMPVGIAIIPIPTRLMTDAKIFPTAVTGYTSPYPTVVSVQIAHHSDAITFGNSFGCTGYSTVYMTMAENSIMKKHITTDMTSRGPDVLITLKIT